MANISKLTPRLWTGGDLPYTSGPEEMLRHLQDIREVGIRHLIDNRIECTDEEFVARHCPAIGYTWNGADDAGQRMPDTWFDTGVGAALEVLGEPEGGAVLAHCHMGINRGPSMAFAIMLALGHEPVEALATIRRARPIAAIGYSLDALDWWHREVGVPCADARAERAAVRSWHSTHPLDVVRIIATARAAESRGAAWTA